MKKYGVLVFFLLSNVLIYGQVEEQKEESDSITPVEGGEMPYIYQDSLRVDLTDIGFGREIDSLWEQELTNSDLFPKIEKNILDNPYEDVDMAVLDYQELSTETLKERLEELDQKTPFTIQYSKELERMIHFYLERDKKSMERLMSLSLYYFPMFEKELDKYNLPLELKYLPIIESALNPHAKSRVGATGLWQFMFGTGKHLNLTISNYVDERMDPEKSTRAAVEYLSELYTVFGNWDLALASYNSGPGNVSKAIRRSGGETDFWKLKRFLPRETANYVPAFLASVYLFNYADEHGFEPYEPDAIYYQTDTIHVKQTVNFDQIVQTTGIDEDLLSFLNPAYKLNIIPKIKGKDYVLRLPIKEAGIFVANEDLIYDYVAEELENEHLPKYYQSSDKVRYHVKPGDNLSKLAARYGVTLAKIRQWNNLPNNNLRAGQMLIIYPNQLADGNKQEKLVTAKNKKSLQHTREAQKSTKEKYYTVEKGDTLWGISKKLGGVSIQQIKKWNDLGNGNVKPGMELKVSDDS